MDLPYDKRRAARKQNRARVVVQFDVEAALRHQLAIPQARDRRYHIKAYRYPLRGAGGIKVKAEIPGR